MNRTKWIRIGLICLFIIGLLSASVYADWQPKIKYLTVFNGTLGGGWHPVATLTSEIIHGAIPQITAKPGPGGGVANAKKLQAGGGKIGMCLSNTQVEAYKGLGTFGKPHSHLRHMVSLYNLPLVWIVRKDSDITSLSQLGDKNISTGKVGQTTFVVGQAMLKAYGITLNSIKAKGGVVHILGDRERVNMLKDKHIDAMSLAAPLNHANFLSLKVIPGIRLISIDKDKLKTIIDSTLGIAELVIPAGFFDKDQKEDVYSISLVTTLICRADLEDELVYRLVKAVVENNKRYEQYVPKTDILMHLKPLQANMIPVHPGSMRYFKEKGLVK
jgi:TRAP transporter TAXI family solute receptor